VPGLLKTLRHEGVRSLFIETVGTHSDFSGEGLSALTIIAGLGFIANPNELNSNPSAAGIVYQPVTSAGPAPCTRVSTGAGVLVIRAKPNSSKLMYYCPFPRPHYYGTVKTGEN